MMKKQYLIILLLASVFSASTVIAEEASVELDSSVNTRPVKMEMRVKTSAQVQGLRASTSASTTLKARIEAHRAEMDAKREAMRLQFEAKRASSTARRVEWQQDVAKRKVENTVRVMTATVEHLEKIILRIESRIAKVKALGGVTLESEGFIASAKADLALAKTSISAFATIDLSSDKAKENFERIRKAAAEAREHIRSAHKNMMKAVRALPHTEVEVNASSTTSVSL